MEEPTQWEILRQLQRDVQQWVSDRALYVTQEQRAADKQIQELKHTALENDVIKEREEDRARIKALEDGKTQLQRIILSAFILPALILVGAYLMGVKP